jgi:hypothetical protein
MNKSNGGNGHKQSLRQTCTHEGHSLSLSARVSFFLSALVSSSGFCSLLSNVAYVNTEFKNDEGRRRFEVGTQKSGGDKKSLMLFRNVTE